LDPFLVARDRLQTRDRTARSTIKTASPPFRLSIKELKPFFV
jgi:hypothetical protein